MEKKEIKDFMKGLTDGLDEDLVDDKSYATDGFDMIDEELPTDEGLPIDEELPEINLEDDNLFDDLNENEENQIASYEESLGTLDGTDDSIDLIDTSEKIFRDKDDETKALLLSVVSSLTYPADYPNVDELFKMKKTHGSIYIVELGSFVDKVTYNTDVKTYVFTSVKPYHFEEFKKQNKDGDLEGVEFSDYLIKETVLYPVLDNNDIKNMSAGEYFYVLNHIRSKSYLNTEASIVKI